MRLTLSVRSCQINKAVLSAGRAMVRKWKMKITYLHHYNSKRDAINKAKGNDKQATRHIASELALRIRDKKAVLVPVLTDREERRTMRVAICIQEQIYDALKGLLGNLKELPDSCKIQSFGYMDLNLDRFEQRNTTSTIALSHYYKHPSGDMIPDPDVEIRIFHELEMAEALSFQDIFGYKQVYHENGYIDAEAKTMLNKFLLQWLRNLKAQGFKREEG